MKRFSGYISILLLLAACETVVDVKVPPSASQISAQGFFTADSAWAVRVVESVDFTSALRPRLVDDATVEIRENGAPLITLTRADSGSYTAIGKKPALDRSYSLHVSVPGYPEVRGLDILPPKPNVVGISAGFAPQNPDLPARRRVVDVKIALNDPLEMRNHYGLLLVQARLQENRLTRKLNPLSPSLFLFESKDLALGESQLGFLDPENEQYIEAFFSDGLFDGQAYTLNFSFQYELAHPTAEVITHRAFAVILLSVSEHFFEYWETAGDQAFSNENPFAEPLRVHSNITGGLGIFAGFQYEIYPVVADSFTLNTACSLAGQYQTLCDTLLQANIPKLLR